MNTVFGRKIGMTQIFDSNGVLKAVTVVELEDLFVSQIKTIENDHYNAVQISFGKTKSRNKPQSGHLKKAGLSNLRTAREIRLDNSSNYTPGQVIDALQVLKEGSKITICSVSKGKGFQGVVKRHHFSGGPKTHGQSDRHRAPGSLGQTSSPSRVFKNMRMAGRMGGDRVTMKNLVIEKIIPSRKLVLVGGALPGGKNALIQITMQ